MRARVKICGLTRPEDVETAIAHGADYLGFIVEARSPRRLSVSDAARLSLPAKGIIPRVAVTVNADDDTLKSIAEDMQPDLIQFHGEEPPEHVAAIATWFGIKTIKALAISSIEDLIAARTFFEAADIVLLDARPPNGSDVRGGHGVSFDWDLLGDAKLPTYHALAGGLTPDNVQNAVSKTQAPMLDVSSGVESSPGIKDPDKIAALMAHLDIS